MAPNNTLAPPALMLRFLRWFCDRALIEDVEGDLTELYHLRAANMGKRKADLLFARDVMLLVRPGIVRNFNLDFSQIDLNMLYHHFKTALRVALRNKGYTSLNLAGLVVGLASSMLILLWVTDELSVNKFHEKSDRLYQVVRDMVQASGQIETTRAIPRPLEFELRNYPEVEHVTLVSWENDLLFSLGDKTSYEKGRYVSPDFFNMFSFPLLAGNPASLLNDIHSVVISETLARKFFGDAWQQALGQLIKIDASQEFKITGIFADIPANSSLRFDYVLPAEEYIQRNDWVDSWFSGGFGIFIDLREGADIDAVKKRIHQEINVHTDHAADEPLYLQRLTDVYLYYDFQKGVAAGGRIEYVRVLAVIALFILLIACINFMNLATARSSTRSREIGVKKVLGAQRGSLGLQFFAESIIHTLASVAVASLIVFLTLPYFNELTHKSLVFNLSDEKVWAGLIAVTLMTGLLSGSYPALLLSSFRPIDSLKGKSKQGSPANFMRQGLTTFQFAISIFLIGGTIIVSRQMDYLLNQDLGVNKENVVMISMDGDLYGKNEVYRAALQGIPEVQSVTFSSGNPIRYGSSTGGAQWEGKDPSDVVEINVIAVEEQFLETMQIDVVKGEGFTNTFTRDSAHFLINEVLADIMGFDDPVGKRISLNSIDGTIIGVVRNYHMASLYEPIDPLIIRTVKTGTTSAALIRVQGSTRQALARIEEVTKRLNPVFPFVYTFLDEQYASMYEGEKAVSKLVNIFAFVSIFLSCLGLLGLSSFSADQRSREIGIRKVHGAPTTSLVALLSGSYARLIAIAFLIAGPVLYWYMHIWLDNFAFRTDFGIVHVAIAGAVAFALGALTVGVRSYQAATANPVKTLRED